jgi:uncharacterized protein YjiS (DUF1127 family)
MSTATSMNTSGFGGSSFKAPQLNSNGIISRIVHYFDCVKAENQLAALDDRMLADIGIDRADIHDLVRGISHTR